MDDQADSTPALTSQGSTAQLRIQSTLFLYLEMAKHREEVALAERERRMRFFTPSQLLRMH